MAAIVSYIYPGISLMKYSDKYENNAIEFDVVLGFQSMRRGCSKIKEGDYGGHVESQEQKQPHEIIQRCKFSSNQC